MRRSVYFAFILVALCLAQGGGIRDLRCENEVNPRGIKAQHPQLSWIWGAAAHRALIKFS